MAGRGARGAAASAAKARKAARAAGESSQLRQQQRERERLQRDLQVASAAGILAGGGAVSLSGLGQQPAAGAPAGGPPAASGLGALCCDARGKETAATQHASASVAASLGGATTAEAHGVDGGDLEAAAADAVYPCNRSPCCGGPSSGSADHSADRDSQGRAAVPLEDAHAAVEAWGPGASSGRLGPVIRSSRDKADFA